MSPCIKSRDWALLATSYGIPSACAEGLALYIEHKILPGGFVTAVLENDLKSACAKADSQNQTRLFNYVNFLYNEAPACWGSPEKVKEWLS